MILPRIFNRKSDFEGEWQIYDADARWAEMVMDYADDLVERGENIDDGEFEDYIAEQRKGGYFEFEGFFEGNVASFYCECHKPLSFYSFMFGNQASQPYNDPSMYD